MLCIWVYITYTHTIPLSVREQNLQGPGCPLGGFAGGLAGFRTGLLHCSLARSNSQVLELLQPTGDTKPKTCLCVFVCVCVYLICIYIHIYIHIHIYIRIHTYTHTHIYYIHIRYTHVCICYMNVVYIGIYYIHAHHPPPRSRAESPGPGLPAWRLRWRPCRQFLRPRIELLTRPPLSNERERQGRYNEIRHLNNS